MKKMLLICAFCFLPGAKAPAYVPDATITYDVGAGYRHDALSWSLAGYNNHPNILSELQWNDLQIPVVSAQVKMKFCNYLYFRAYSNYGWILKGKNQDSDYDGDFRTLEWSRSVNKANNGHVYDCSVALGWTFPFCNEDLWLNPILGYSLHDQYLYMHNGNQIINTDYPDDVGPFRGLDSRYNAHWKGFWGGMDIDYLITCNWILHGQFEYHWATIFRGQGHWNLRNDFLGDFFQEANGHGVILGGGMDYHITSDWLLGIAGKYQHFKTKKGIDKVRGREDDYAPFGTPGHRTYYTRLNGVKWRSYSITGHLKYQF